MDEALKHVFPLLSGKDLASCLSVSHQWHSLASDDLLWKSLCHSRWPSTSHNSHSLAQSRGYHNLYSTLAAARSSSKSPLFPTPTLGFIDLEFYVDVWVAHKSVYSAIVDGPRVRSRITDPPPGICPSLEDHLRGSEYKMTLPVSPRFEVSFSEETSMSMVVRRKDSNRIATLIHGSRFDYVDDPEHRAHAYDFLRISAGYPFVSGVRAWVALLMVDGKEGRREVFGIELDFLDTASSDEEVLCLLDILDWK